MPPMTDADDLALVAASRRGDRTAFNELVKRHHEKVYWVARRLLGDHDDALDITQDAFVKAWSTIGNFRGDAQPYTWLYRIATNLSLNKIRAAKVRTLLRLNDDHDNVPGDDLDPLAGLAQSEARSIIERAIARLPDKQRAVFVLRYYEELPYDDIAAILQTSVGGLKANYFHAVRKIEASVRDAMQ